MVMVVLPKPREAFIRFAAAYNKPGEKVDGGRARGAAALPAEAAGNRLGLARWLVSPEQPLTARVTVNRYWQTFFGTGLVKTVGEISASGRAAIASRLIDWLATEFIGTQMGREAHAPAVIVTERQHYRQSSRATSELLERDPDNRLLARAPRYRLPSWMIRDQALAASGLLVDKIGGESVKPYQPSGVWEEATFGKKTYQQDKGDKSASPQPLYVLAADRRPDRVLRHGGPTGLHGQGRSHQHAAARNGYPQ